MKVSLLELAQRVNDLSQRHECSETELMWSALNAFERALKLGRSPVEREYMCAHIDVLAQEGSSLFAYIVDLQKAAK